LLRDLLRMQGSRCQACAAPLCGHETLLSLVAGMQDAPRCCSCLSVVLERSREQVRDLLFGYIASRSCYHHGWLWANRMEGLPPAALPACLWPTGGNNLPTPFEGEGQMPSQSPPHSFPVPPIPDDEWDAGSIGCGELLMLLRPRMLSLQPGQILRLIAQDGGAPEDIPAWCRLTGHKLISANHPEYWIQRKEI